MRGAALAALWLLSLAATPVAQAQDPQTGLEAQVELAPPRQFGYRIGDTLAVRAQVGVPRGFELEVASLGAGELPEWLEVRERSWDVREGTGRTDRTYEVRTVFQVFYAPDSLTRLAIPERRLVFRGAGGERVEATIPAIELSITPMTDRSSRMAANYPVPSASPRRVQVAVGALGALLLLAGAGAVARRRGRRSRPFRRAHREALGTDDCAEAALALHRALESYTGAAVFAEDLELVATSSGVGSLEREWRRFFELSEMIFYEDDGRRAPADCLERVRELSRRLMEVEERARHRPGRRGSAWSSPGPGS